MNTLGDFELPKWIEGQKHLASAVAAGSTGPSMSLNDLKAISTDPDKTAAALKLDDLMLNAYSVDDSGVAERIAALYDPSIATVTPDDVVVLNGTTGANGTVFQALVSSGDHIVATWPVYGPLVDLPRALGAEISFIELRDEAGWEVDVSQLKALLRPGTKMMILNNPHNPTGAVMSNEKQAEIVALAAERGIIVLCDEIFRPLFHSVEKPTSMLEHADYDRIVVTGSLSKAWGFPGIRIGWAATRNKEMREKIRRIKEWIVQDVSVVDKKIAMEVLSERCKDNIMKKNIGYAKKNLKALEGMMEKHKNAMSCCLPPGGATAFVRFLSPRVNGTKGGPVDEMEFCKRLLKEKGLLLSPGPLGFGPDREGMIKGYTRVHMTLPPQMFGKVIGILEEFLVSESFASLSV